MTTEAIVPTADDDAQLAALRDALRDGEPHLTTADGTDVALPASAREGFVRVVEYLADGEPVMIIPADAELTTGEAAEILDLSRQMVVHILDSGQIPHHRVGSHRRVLLRDVIRYREDMRRQQAGLREIARLSQEMGLYDMTPEEMDSFSRDAGLNDEA